MKTSVSKETVPLTMILMGQCHEIFDHYFLLCYLIKLVDLGPI